MPPPGLHAQEGRVMRSLLFVPGDSPKKLEKGLSSGADILLIDLEDSVALSAKQEARRVTAAFLAEQRATAGRPRLYVRVNGLTTGMIDADLDGVMNAAPDGIVLPKAVGGADVAHLGAKLAVREAEYGLDDGATRILAIATENAAGIFALGTFAGASHRLMGLTWGGEDLSADLGAEANRDENGAYTEPYRLARSLTLFGAAAAGIDAIDSVYTNFRDMAGLEAECRMARRDGFVAKMAIHPAQVPVINEAFTPSPEAIARAQAVLDAFKANPEAGVVGVEGEMLDRPHLLRAERLLRRAGRS
jgi:citrate lyase subunit beta/citryl-CoA lyase